MNDPSVQVASVHAEAGQRQAALNFAIASMSGYDTPPSSDALIERAVAFYGFLAVTPHAG